jgi:hypothetical protein
VVSTHAAPPILGIVEAAWQQLARARRLDDVGGAITPHLRPLGIKRDKEMQALAGIGVRRGEQRGIGDVEIRLVSSIGQCNTSCSLLAGVSKAKVFRGR